MRSQAAVTGAGSSFRFPVCPRTREELLHSDARLIRHTHRGVVRQHPPVAVALWCGRRTSDWIVTSGSPDSASGHRNGHSLGSDFGEAQEFFVDHNWLQAR